MIRFCFFSVIFVSIWITAKAVIDRPWFNYGSAPLQIYIHDPADLSAESCKNCHQAEYDDWSRSKHREAFTNPHFQEGFLLEKADRCVYCHAPLQAQFDEYKGKSKTQLLNEGVNCAACHIRDGKFWSGQDSSDIWHQTEKNDLFKSSKYCAGCHQFNLDHTVNGRTEVTDLNAQNTFREWESYQQKGGTKTCQQCHMPDGRHLFQGAHTIEMLKSSISLQVVRSKNILLFRFQSQNVGHNVPTGDVFRNFQLQVSKDGKNFETVHFFGKKYEIEVSEEDGKMRQTLVSNTSLEPFQEVVIRYPSKKSVKYRVRYYFVSEKGYRMSQQSKNKLQSDIFEGWTP